jgi:STE24 endopeptidase
MKDYFLDYLNSKFFDKKIPENLNDIYDKEKYQKSQDYKKTLYKFGKISKAYSLTILLLFFFLDGFLFVDNFTRSVFDSELLTQFKLFWNNFFWE